MSGSFEAGAYSSPVTTFDEFSETVAGLPYSLWALSDASGWLSWVPWLVRLWGIQETRSLLTSRKLPRGLQLLEGGKVSKEHAKYGFVSGEAL